MPLAQPKPPLTTSIVTGVIADVHASPPSFFWFLLHTQQPLRLVAATPTTVNGSPIVAQLHSSIRTPTRRNRHWANFSSLFWCSRIRIGGVEDGVGMCWKKSGLWMCLRLKWRREWRGTCTCVFSWISIFFVVFRRWMTWCGYVIVGTWWVDDNRECRCKWSDKGRIC